MKREKGTKRKKEKEKDIEIKGRKNVVKRQGEERQRKRN